jgi:hypothetical protein
VPSLSTISASDYGALDAGYLITKMKTAKTTI